MRTECGMILSDAHVSATTISWLNHVMLCLQIGIPNYFGDSWNVFDCLIVVVSVVGVIVDFATPANLTFMPLLRILRVARIFKLIPKAKGLRMMLNTFVW